MNTEKLHKIELYVRIVGQLLFIIVGLALLYSVVHQAVFCG